MANYLIINTGGTIGMVQGEDGLEPNQEEVSSAFKTRPELASWASHDLTWEHWSPLLDSSDLQPHHWFQIHDSIKKQSAIDGVLVIHGTDTLAYTAAALSFMLNDLNIPIVITGSMLPISVENTDAIDNLMLSLRALEEAKAEVVVAIGEMALPGSRISKSSTYKMDSFDTPGWDSELWSVASGKATAVFEPFQKTPQIDVFTLFPGISYGNLRKMIESGSRAIIINAFGNGNTSSSLAFQECLVLAKQTNVPVFVRSQCFEGSVDFGLYAASSLLTEMSAISCGNMPFEAVVTKLTLLCAKWDNRNDIVAEFNKAYAREWQSKTRSTH
jgi:L-asparaginase